MKLYEEMTSNTTMEKSKNIANNVDDENKPTDIKPTLTEPPIEKEKTFIRKPSEEKPASIEDISHGSYVVGGSAFGWNFITYPSSKYAAYYGTTKEDYRAANPISPPIAENVE